MTVEWVDGGGRAGGYVAVPETILASVAVVARNDALLSRPRPTCDSLRSQ